MAIEGCFFLLWTTAISCGCLPEICFLIEPGNSQAAAVTDLNGDAKADLIVTTAVVGQIVILIGQGDGSFASSSSVLDIGGNCTDAIVADFNQDQRPDLAVECQFGDRFEVLFNRGKPAVNAPAVELSWSFPADGYARGRGCFAGLLTGQSSRRQFPVAKPDAK